MQTFGRAKIYTTEKEITRANILDVLQDAFSVHQKNRAEIEFLINYERGYQPLKRTKIIRPEINIEDTDNVASYVKEFKQGYFWGEPAFLVQRGNNEAHGTDEEADSYGIAELNELLMNGAHAGYLDQILSDYVEICGIGHQMVEIKSDIESKDDVLFNLYTLDSRYAFCVYYNGVGSPLVMGVTYRDTKEGRSFTCVTKDTCYEIREDEIVSEYPNFLGAVNIVEFERNVDRTGCFERCISDMDTLNIMVSDLANDVDQRTQEVWWGNDIEFPKDPNTGKPIPPKNGQWVLTTSGADKNPKIAPLSSTFNAETLNTISYRWSRILQKCKVPVQQDSEGGGSTGTAMNLSSGWSAAEVDAKREEQIIRMGKQQVVKLILKAISFVDTDIVPEDAPVRKVHFTDVDLHFNRNKNYDLAVKANALATFLAHGLNGKHALRVIDAFPDVEQVWLDSKESIEMYQASIYERYHDSSYDGTSENVYQPGNGTKSAGSDSDRIMADTSDQISNSPIIDGQNTTTGGANGK